VSDLFARLAWPLAASLAIHIGVGWVFFTRNLQHLPSQGKSITLTVVLAANRRAEPPKVAAAEPTSTLSPASAAAAPPPIEGRITEKARFLVAPDLSSLESIAVPLSGSLTFRLYVSALGTVDRIEVIKSAPVPRELLDGLLEKLRQTRLTPALAGSRPVSSSLDLVIRYENEITPLPRNP
jgi:outer membrane biosynthesis protein TonB